MMLSLGVLLMFAADHADVPMDHPSILRLRDAYLEPFTRFASAAELREVFANAYLLAPIGRAHVWRRILGPFADDVSAEYDDPLSGWIEILHGIATGTIKLGGA